MRRKTVCLIKMILAFTAAAAMAGCNSAGYSKRQALSVSGSTTLFDFAEKTGQAFEKQVQETTVEVQGVGSSAGIKAVADGLAEIGMSSRELKEDELALGLTKHTVAYDGIVVAVHPSNPVTALTSEQIRQIFQGEITNWSQLGGADRDIVLVSREEGSGTRSSFEELTGIEEQKETALICNSNGSVKSTLASKESAIAYVSFGIVDDTVKAVAIDGVMPTLDSIKSGEFMISRSLYFLTKGTISPQVQHFIDFVTGPEGQEIASEYFVRID